MINFSYYNPAKIFFGADSPQKLPSLLKEFNVNNLLIVYSGDFIKTLGIYDVITESCHSLGIKLFESGNVVPNPKIELIRELVTLGKKEKIDFILAVGGGSSIDTAKAVALGIPYESDVWDFFNDKATVTEALPIGVISTLPSSGSETSNAAIVSNGLAKRGVEDNLIIPKFAIMNPHYTLELPKYQTACGIADILAHLLERYFSPTNKTDTTDFLIEGAIKALFLNTERLLKNPRDYDARSEVQWIASIAHNNLLDTGRLSDWGSHRIEHEISAQYDMTHGEGMAIVFIAWCSYMSKNKPDRLAQLANRLYNIDYHDYTKEEMANKLKNNLKSFFQSLNLKTTLTEAKIDNTHFEAMANRATNNNTQTIGHYIELSNKEIIEILNLAL